MRSQRPDFEKPNQNLNDLYDFRMDWDIIEASIAKQYSIRLRQCPNMPWPEFSTLVQGLMADTPLGTLITIRGETDPKVIKGFTPDQQRIRREWLEIKTEKIMQNPEKAKADLDNLSKILSAAFGSKKRGENIGR
jgi:hypothetical protein